MISQDVLKKYEVRGVNPDRLKAIEKYAGKSVLDVGCGSGAYVLKLKEKMNIHGVDHRVFPSWELATERFQVADAADLSNYKDSSWETILSFETLEHLQDPQKALAEYYRVTQKNMILTVPNCDVPPELLKGNLIFSHWNDPTHVNFFNKQTLLEHIEQAGFQVEVFNYINKVRFDYLLDANLGSSVLDKLLRKIILTRFKKDYFITCLVVANKRK